MSSADNNPRSSEGPGAPHVPRRPEGVIRHEGPTPHTDSARLAHELANLLDGSLRNVGLVMSSLRDGPDDPARGKDDDDAIRRLETVNQGLRQMAQLVQRWMRDAHAPEHLHSQTRSLGEVAEHAVRLLLPAAAARQIKINVRLDPAAAALPAGPVYPVIANALRNSIEAIGNVAGPNRGHGIDLLARCDGGDVVVEVRDDGPGLNPSLLNEHGRFLLGKTTKPDGHGLGLTLCVQVAQSLGGGIDIRNLTPHGAVFTLRYPASAAQSA